MLITFRQEVTCSCIISALPVSNVCRLPPKLLEHNPDTILNTFENGHVICFNIRLFIHKNIFNLKDGFAYSHLCDKHNTSERKKHKHKHKKGTCSVFLVLIFLFHLCYAYRTADRTSVNQALRISLYAIVNQDTTFQISVKHLHRS